MSFILDALRKAEHSRQMSTGATLAELPIGRRSRSLPWWVIALAGLLFANMAVLAVLLMRDQPEQSVEDRPLPAPTAQPVVSRPVTNTSPLAAEVELPAQVEYETVPRSELEIANAAASVPEGPTIVRPSEQVPEEIDSNAQTPSRSNEVRVDMHVYSDSPRDRWVLIGMKRYTEGQRLPDGTLIEQITPGGVVVVQHGSRTMLHR